MITEKEKQENMINLIAELIKTKQDTMLKTMRKSISKESPDLTRLNSDDKELCQTIDIYFDAKDEAETLIREYIFENELTESCEIELESDIIKIFADATIVKYRLATYMGIQDQQDIHIKNINFELITE